MKEVINFIIENWKEGLGISIFILELIVRIKPTDKDWSIVNKIISVLDLIIPNLEVDKETGKLKRKKKINVIKVIGLFFVLSVFSINANAQQNPNNKFTAIYSSVSDTAFIQSTRTSLQSNFGNYSGLYFDKIRNKWRIWNGSAWADLGMSSGGGGGIGGSIAITQVAYGSAANTIKGESDFVYNETTNVLTVPKILLSTIPSTDNASTPLSIDGSGNITKKTDIMDGFGVANRIPYWSDFNTLTSGMFFDPINIRVGIGGTPAYDLDILGSGATTARIFTSGINGISLAFQRISGTASDWQIYNPAASTDLRFYSGSDRFIMQADGKFKLLTTPTNDNTETSVLVRQSDGEFQTKNDLIDGVGIATNIPYFSDANTITSENAFTYTAGSDLLTVPNATHSTNLTLSYIASGNVPFATTDGAITSETAYQYNSTLNSVNINNVAGTATTTVFGGEIQLDDVTNSDDLTLTPISIIGTGGASFTIGTVSTPLTLKSSSGDLSVTAVGGLSSGVYTPTLTNVTNVTSSTLNAAHYSRVGDQVTMVLDISIVSTTGGSALTEIDFSLPVASNFTVTSDLTGFSIGFNNNIPAVLDADAVNDRANLRYLSAGAAQSNGFVITLMYTVK